MKIRTVVGLTALGGLLYAHGKRGGELTIDSFKETLRGLWLDTKQRAKGVAESAQDELHQTQGGKASGETVTGYGSSGYGYDDPTRH